MKQHHVYISIILANVIAIQSLNAQNNPVAVWNFENIAKTEKITPQGKAWWQKPEMKRRFFIEEHVSGEKSSLFGNYFKEVPGVSGNALLLDGITSYVEYEGTNIPDLEGDFSIGAWIALGAYPTNWCPVADHNTSSGKGFFMGIDAYGHAGFKIFNKEGERFEVLSEQRIPLREWTHIDGVYSQT